MAWPKIDSGSKMPYCLNIGEWERLCDICQFWPMRRAIRMTSSPKMAVASLSESYANPISFLNRRSPWISRHLLSFSKRQALPRVVWFHSLLNKHGKGFAIKNNTQKCCLDSNNNVIVSNEPRAKDVELKYRRSGSPAPCNPSAFLIWHCERSV